MDSFEPLHLIWRKSIIALSMDKDEVSRFSSTAYYTVWRDDNLISFINKVSHIYVIS